MNRTQRNQVTDALLIALMFLAFCGLFFGLFFVFVGGVALGSVAALQWGFIAALVGSVVLAVMMNTEAF